MLDLDAVFGTEAEVKAEQKPVPVKEEIASPLPWDAETGAVELRAAQDAVQRAKALSWMLPSQCRLLVAMQAVIEQYATQRDPLLFGAADWINKYVARWQRERKAS